MWHDSRRGFNLIRNRANVRKNNFKKMQLGVIAGCLILISLIMIYGIVKTVNENSVKPNNTEERANVDIYNDNLETAKKENDNLEISIDSPKNDVKENSENSTMKITALGEIMMGGSYFKSDNYSLAFKEISSNLAGSDYVVSSLATNIASVKDLSNTKTKYIVNENIVNAFNALNIKGINIATDHMLDFSKNMFNSTIETIKKNDMDVIGFENDITYAEKNGTRVAFIGVNNVVIGNTQNYIDAGMFIYNLDKVKNCIKEAKTKADTVIVMTHYGKENIYQVTDVMKWFSKEIIDAGADMVLGGHALGIYPVEEYKGKIIIYSLGYLIHDTNKEQGKKSAIFDINISSDGIIESLDITPTYIDNYVVKLYKEVNENKNKILLGELKDQSNLSKYITELESDKLSIKLNK